MLILTSLTQAPGHLVMLEVCIPGLFLRQDKTGGHFSNCRDRDTNTYVWSCYSGKFRKNLGRDGTGLLSTTQEMVLKCTKIQDFS